MCAVVLGIKRAFPPGSQEAFWEVCRQKVGWQALGGLDGANRQDKGDVGLLCNRCNEEKSGVD